MSFSYAPPTRRVGVFAATMLVLAIIIAALAAAPAHAAKAGTFTTLAPSPNFINAVVTDPTTNLIYAQENANGTTNPGTAFYRYNPATNKWTTRASSPVSMQNNGGAAYLNGKIYVVYSEDSAMAVYDIASNSWTTMASPLGTRTGNITAAGGRIYLADGTSFVSYNPATGVTKQLAAAPGFTDKPHPWCSSGFQRWGSLASYHGKIYGTEGDGCAGFAVYNIASNSWKVLPNVPNSSVLGGVVDPVTGIFYTYGGYGENNWDMYNIAKGTWTRTTYPYFDIGDGGLAYVSAPGRQGVYSTVGDDNTSLNFYRYNTVAGAQVSVKNSASKHHASVGSQFTYTVRVKNSGGSSASKVTLVDRISSLVKIDSVTTTKGKCSVKRPIKCKLGTLKKGKSVKVKITVTAQKAGKAKSTAKVSTASLNLSKHTKSSVKVKIS